MKQKRYHVIIDIEKADKVILKDTAALKKFLEYLPSVIDMHVLKGPEIAEGIPQNPGITGFVIVDFSHISIHTFTEYGEALVDIFSCKPFEQEKAVEAVLKYFKVDRTSARIKEVFWG